MTTYPNYLDYNFPQHSDSLPEIKVDSSPRRDPKDEIIIPGIVDVHQHFREGTDLLYTTSWAAMWCSHVLIMPNTTTPLKTPEQVQQYVQQIGSVTHNNFIDRLIPTIYLTPEHKQEDVKQAIGAGIKAFKVYPKGKTSHSSHGFDDYELLKPLCTTLESEGGFLLLHGEHPHTNSWDAENQFLEETYPQFDQEFPKLKISLEHITTEKALNTVFKAFKAGRPRVATITAHHLLQDFTHCYGNFDVRAFCRPLMKTKQDRICLLNAATSGYECFLFGSDSAPWRPHKKYQESPCAGCWTAPWIPQLLAHAFDTNAALDKLTPFVHDNAIKFWNLKPTDTQIHLKRGNTLIPTSGRFLAFMGGETIPWEAERVEGTW